MCKPFRVTHYVAAGRQGATFECYRTALRAHIASGREVDSGYGWANTTHSVPLPLRHTSLDRVTCPECWREIAAMARRRVGG